MQSLPFEIKVAKTKLRIREWVDFYGEDGVYVSFSGGKDSTVLLHIVREMYPNIEAVFMDTGLEYPEIRKFVKTFDNVTIIRPKMRFDEVIKAYGYPVIGKMQSNAVSLARKNLENGIYSLRLLHLGVSVEEAKVRGLQMPSVEMLERYERTSNGSIYNVHKYRDLLTTDFKISDMCCKVMKKTPAHEYQKKNKKMPILATMAEEGMLREASWLQNGCNAFKSKQPRSAPMSFWTNQDVLQYIKTENITICNVYGEIAYEIEPRQMRIEDYGIFCGEPEKLCTTGCDRTGCIFCAFGAHLEKEPTRFQRLKETHPKQYQYCIGGGEFNEEGIWQPNKEGLGMGYVFDQLNAIYGEGFIKYK